MTSKTLTLPSGAKVRTKSDFRFIAAVEDGDQPWVARRAANLTNLRKWLHANSHRVQSSRVSIFDTLNGIRRLERDGHWVKLEKGRIVHEVPEKAATYFADRGVTETPAITQSFFPGDGWHFETGQPGSFRELRLLKAQGATVVTLSAGSREADFTIRELLAGS